MAQSFSERASYVFEPNTALTEYLEVANLAFSLAVAKGLAPGKIISLTVPHKGRNDIPTNVIRFHELVLSAQPPPYHASGLMWMGTIPGDVHYKLFHVCVTDPPSDPQWVIMTDCSYIYDPSAFVAYINSLSSSGVVGGGGSSLALVALEDLASGDFVNVMPSGVGVRKADARDPDKEASGYVKASFTFGSSALVFFNGINDKVTGQTTGPVFLSTTPGLATTDPSSLTSGQLRQRLGTAITAVSINFQPDISIILA